MRLLVRRPVQLTYRHPQLAAHRPLQSVQSIRRIQWRPRPQLVRRLCRLFRPVGAQSRTPSFLKNFAARKKARFLRHNPCPLRQRQRPCSPLRRQTRASVRKIQTKPSNPNERAMLRSAWSRETTPRDPQAHPLPLPPQRCVGAPSNMARQLAGPRAGRMNSGSNCCKKPNALGSLLGVCCQTAMIFGLGCVVLRAA